MATAPNVEWFGDRIKQKILNASVQGVNAVMAACVLEAKHNHPGWRNITGTAEGSVKIIEFAKQQADHVEGQWGSMGVNYLIWLEYKYGSFLRNAADKLYSTLTGKIKEAMK